MKHERERRICIPRALIESDAFAQLTGQAPRVVLLFYAKRTYKNTGTENKPKWTETTGEITFAYQQARLFYHISAARFTHAIGQGIRFGFIDRTKTGGGAEGDPAKYRVSDRWRKFGQEGFDMQTRPTDYRKSSAHLRRAPQQRTEDGKFLPGSAAEE